MHNSADHDSMSIALQGKLERLGFAECSVRTFTPAMAMFRERTLSYPDRFRPLHNYSRNRDGASAGIFLEDNSTIKILCLRAGESDFAPVDGSNFLEIPDPLCDHLYLPDEQKSDLAEAATLKEILALPPLPPSKSYKS